MSTPPLTYPPLPLRERAMAAAVALTATAALLGALALCFHTASPGLWLTPTPEVLAEVAACERLDAAAARRHCKQQLVAAHLAREQQPRQLARR